MEKLEALASISRLSENVVRVLGQNPGKFTLQGTNTYLVGQTNPYTLIDTGEGKEEYIPILESALRETTTASNPTEPDVSDIVITHWHGDHVGGLPTVLSLLKRLWGERNGSLPFKPPRLHKFPLAAHQIHKRDRLPSIIQELPPDSFTPTPEGNTFHDLHDSQIINSLQVLHTPGHTVDSISLYSSDNHALYTADTVLGQGTSVFEDLGTYLTSLRKMISFVESQGLSSTTLYPGHGPTVTDGVEVMKTYVQHRLEREAQVVKTLKSSPPGSEDSAQPVLWTTWTLVSVIYAAYPESLWLPAAHGISLHLKKLERDGLVKSMGGEGVHRSWIVQEE
ncbi:beta-lactamase-like protein [Mycena floridula]|nr:beta-lactamase-like protein [Mycena floridula]